MSTDASTLPDMDSLPDDPALLKQLLKQVVEQIHEERHHREQLEQRMDLLLKRLYGRTSEKIDPRQGTLFDTAAAVQAEDAVAVPPSETTAPGPKRKGHGRRSPPENCHAVKSSMTWQRPKKKRSAMAVNWSGSGMKSASITNGSRAPSTWFGAFRKNTLGVRNSWKVVPRPPRKT